MEENNQLVIDVNKAKAAVYDYLMTKIMEKDFDSTAAVAGDVLNKVLETGKS
jgi:hypothetical protein